MGMCVSVPERTHAPPSSRQQSSGRGRKTKGSLQGFAGDSAMFEQQKRVTQAPFDKPSSTISSTLVAALASEDTELAHPALPQTLNPLKGHHKYRHVEDLSEGSAGFVVRAENRDTLEQVAIKFIERGSKAMRGVDREVLNLRLCSLHPYVVKFKEVFLTPNYLGIVTDFADQGELATQITKQAAQSGCADMAFTEPEARHLFQQLIIAVDFCHRKGISNRDLKAENVLLHWNPVSNSPTIKLCDFGFSKDERLDSACKTACGTPEYVAPEVLCSADGYDGKPVDIWSAGVVLYVMLSGRFPFANSLDAELNAAEAVQAMFQRILRADFIPLTWISPLCAELLALLLCVEPAKRITMDQLLCHPWFVDGLQEGSLEMNADLQLSDRMLTSFVLQSEAEILRLVHAAMAGKAPAPPRSSSRIPPL